MLFSLEMTPITMAKCPELSFMNLCITTRREMEMNSKEDIDIHFTALHLDLDFKTQVMDVKLK